MRFKALGFRRLLGNCGIDLFQRALSRHGSEKHLCMRCPLIIHWDFQRKPWCEALDTVLQLQDLGFLLCPLPVQRLDLVRCPEQTFLVADDLPITLLIDQILSGKGRQHRLFLRRVNLKNIQRTVNGGCCFFKAASGIRRIHPPEIFVFLQELADLHDAHALQLFQNRFPVLLQCADTDSLHLQYRHNLIPPFSFLFF